MSQLTLTEVAAPATPSTNKVTVYAKAGGRLYCKDDAGTEYDLTGGDGIAVLTGVLRADAGVVSVDADVTDIVSDMVGDSGSGGTAGLAPAPGTGDAAAGKFLKADGVWTAPAGGGDVVGPAASVDNAIARFDSTTGKLLQGYTSNPPTISDTGDVTIDGDLSADNTVVATYKVFDDGGETITGDGTDMTVASGGAINLTATTDVVVPANVGVTFGTGEKIEGDSTDLTITSGAKINLTAVSDVHVPVNVGVIWGDGAEKIESDNTDLTINSGGEILLTATSDVVIPVNIGLHLGDGTSKLKSDDTDLTVNAGGDINLTATTDINIPANVGLTFGDDGEKIEGDGTDLTIAGNNINLTAVGDVIIPANVGVTFGTGEKIEGDSTDLTVTSGGAINLTAVTDVVVPANVGVTFGAGEKIEGDDTDLTITSGADIALTATGDVNVPANVGMTFGDDGEKIEGDGSDLTIASSGVLNLSGTTSVKLGGTLALNEQAILVDAALASDGTWTGPTQSVTAGEELTIGETAYLKSDGKYWLADADAEATADTKIVMATATISAEGTGIVLLPSALSFMRVDATTEWTVTGAGDTMFISTTAGELTNDVSGYTAGDIVRVAGYMETATIINFDAGKSYVEIV